ncbi:MAG: hypothetical protein AAFO96_03730 [Bacteroidota bacterium]
MTLAYQDTTTKIQLYDFNYPGGTYQMEMKLMQSNCQKGKPVPVEVKVCKCVAVFDFEHKCNGLTGFDRGTYRVVFTLANEADIIHTNSLRIK